MKVQAHSSLETPLEYNQDQTLLVNQGLFWPFQLFLTWELQKYYVVSDLL